MKQTKILLALMMLAVFASCNDEFVDNTNSRHISITAELPDDNLTRASLSQKEGSLDFLTQWDEGDVVNLHIEQDGRFYEVKYTRPNALPGEVSFNQIPIKNISEDRKSCTLDFDLPEGVDADRPYKVYGSTFCRGVVGSDDDDNKVLVFLCSFYRTNNMSIPLYCEVESNALSSGIEFKHFLAYEILHIKNNSKETISFTHKGFDVDKAWYHLGCGIYIWPTYHYIETKYYTNKDSGERIEINAGETKDILSCYYPTGEKIENARLKAIINGNEVLSSDTKSSDLDIEPAKAYHMYAIWDGDELKFGKEDIRETIIYPTSSYQLSEDGKTLVKWLGEETEIDMSADPAFDEVEIIGYKAFAWSTAKTIKLSNKAKEIEQWAFNYASTKKIYLPKSITTIAYEAFAKCTDLEEVHITDLSAWCKIRFTDAWSNPFTYASSLFVNNDKIVDLVIPDDIDKIGKYTFRGADIETVTMSDNVTDIGEDAFSFCENLKRIQFSSNLAVIDYCAFRGCKSLEEVWLPESLNYLGDMSFDLCNKIRTVYIGKNLHYIGFSFRCSNLENFIVSNQNKYLFAVDGILYSNVFKYSTETNDYILDHASLTCYPGGRSDNSYTLPDFAIYIQDFAFMQSKNLTTVILHSGMTEIGSLNYLFNETEVPNLNKVIIYATTPPSSYSGHSGTHSYEYGYGINPHTTLYVPSESVDTYKADENWGKFGTILPLGSGMPDDDADVIDDDPAEDPFGD